MPDKWITGDDSFLFLSMKNCGTGEASLLRLLKSTGVSSSLIPGVARVLIEGEGTKPMGRGPLNSIIISL